MIAALALSVAIVAGPPPDLSGTWAQLQVTRTVSRVPVLGELIGTTRAVLRLQIQQRGERLLWREQVCALELGSGSDRVTLSVSPAFLRAVSGSRRRGRLERNEGRWRVALPRHTVVHGAALANPTSDPLPLTADDPRVRDADGDGRPGLTVRVRGLVMGELFVVQRDWSALRSRPLTRPDRFDGLIRWGSDQRVLDATSALLRRRGASTPHSDASRHWFRTRRVSASSTCADILAGRRRLFAR